MTNESPISAVPVERDLSGAWRHPRYFTRPSGRKGQRRTAFSHWLKRHGLVSAVSWMENESTEQILREYEATGCFLDWTPAAPPGPGWFTGSIHDSDEGPLCVWLKSATGGER